MSASAAATVVSGAAGNAETKSDVMATGVQGETEMAAQDVQTLSAGAPSTDEALTLSMMAAGRERESVSHHRTGRCRPFLRVPLLQVPRLRGSPR